MLYCVARDLDSVVGFFLLLLFPNMQNKKHILNLRNCFLARHNLFYVHSAHIAYKNSYSFLLVEMILMADNADRRKNRRGKYFALEIGYRVRGKGTNVSCSLIFSLAETLSILSIDMQDARWRRFARKKIHLPKSYYRNVRPYLKWPYLREY